MQDFRWLKELWQAKAGGGVGVKVFRPAAADPVNATLPIFTIAGGLVLVRHLVGIRTVLQAGGTPTLKFQHSIGTTDLCAAAAITGNDVLTFYTITGNFTDALQIAVVGVPKLGGIRGGLLATGNQGDGLYMQPGNISVVTTAGATAGSTRYIIIYVPIDSGANIVPA
jgi:hypothetical protein